MMTPYQSFITFSNYILSPTDTGYYTFEQMADFAAGYLSRPDRTAAAKFLQDHLADTDKQLLTLWVRSNSRVGPGPDNVRRFTQVMISRLLDPSVPTRDFL